MTAPARLLHITDCHLLPDPGSRLLGVDTSGTLAAVLAQALEEFRPDAILATGDLGHEGGEATYRRFLELVTSRYDGPLLCVPGNHDAGEPFAAVLGREQTLTLGDWQVLGFDTHEDDRPGGRLAGADRQRLIGRIAAADGAHLLLACHHPPLPVGCPWLDKDCIPQGRDLLDSCAAASAAAGTQEAGRLRGLVCGHVHQALAARHGPIDVLATPSTCFQFEPGSQRFSIDRTAGSGMPGYRWLTLEADGRLRSEVRRLRGAPLNIDLSEVS
jgi:Icc protein